MGGQQDRTIINTPPTLPAHPRNSCHVRRVPSSPFMVYKEPILPKRVGTHLGELGGTVLQRIPQIYQYCPRNHFPSLFTS